MRHHGREDLWDQWWRYDLFNFKISITPRISANKITYRLGTVSTVCMRDYTKRRNKFSQLIKPREEDSAEESLVKTEANEKTRGSHFNTRAVFLFCMHFILTVVCKGINQMCVRCKFVLSLYTCSSAGRVSTTLGRFNVNRRALFSVD